MPDDVPSEPLDPAKEHERLDALEEKIQRVKRQAEDDLDPHHGEQTYASSGETPEADDQEITPPG